MWQQVVNIYVYFADEADKSAASSRRISMELSTGPSSDAVESALVSQFGINPPKEFENSVNPL
jgi:hypothetical protein